MPHDVFQQMTRFFQGRSVLVALSGGTDSAALAHFLSRVPGVELTAVTAAGPHMPASELKRAERFCRENRIKHIFLPADPLEADEVRRGDSQRCYYCKRRVFSALKHQAAQMRADLIVDGTHHDDKSDYRPGMRALKELEVFSPFLEFGLGKVQIRHYMIAHGLEEHIHPSNACLITRLPYGAEVSRELLKTIDRAEDFIRSLGVTQVRCRVHGALARIEVEKEDILRILNESESITVRFSQMGFKHITLDIRGYRTGGAN